MPLRERSAWLRGERFPCLQPPVPPGRCWRLVLLGPPGVGKGTQANLLASVLGACPLSTGDIFRAAQEQAPTQSGLRFAIDAVNCGELVPDDVVIRLVQERRACLRCRAGFLLDGLPRTLAQAASLDGLLAAERVRLDAVIHYDLPTADLVERLSGRRVCLRCQAPYHLTRRAPRRAGVCDACGGPVVQRPDDLPEAVERRLEVYAEATARVVDYYRRDHLLLNVSATGSPEEILSETLRLLAGAGFDVLVPGQSMPPPAAAAGTDPTACLNPPLPA